MAHGRLRSIIYVLAMASVLVAAYAVVLGLLRDTSYPAKIMTGWRSAPVLMADCRKDIRVSCYELARKVDKNSANSIVVLSSLSRQEAGLIAYGYGRACDLGYSDGCWNLATESLTPDQTDAMHESVVYMKKDCRLGNLAACSEVGRLQQMEADVPCAKALTLLVAEPPLDEAAENLAKSLPTRERCIFALGLINEDRSNYLASAKFYKAAAMLGNGTAMFDLGNLYSKGWGVPRDKGEALVWYNKALVSLDASNFRGQNDGLVADVRGNIAREQAAL